MWQKSGRLLNIKQITCPHKKAHVCPESLCSRGYFFNDSWESFGFLNLPERLRCPAFCVHSQRLFCLSSWLQAPSWWRPTADPLCTLCRAPPRSLWFPGWCSSGGTLDPVWPFPHLNRRRDRIEETAQKFNTFHTDL